MIFMIEILVVITIILCSVMLVMMLKGKKDQQDENLKIKEEMMSLLTEKLSENNQKNLEENKRKFTEMENSVILNTKNGLLQGINELNKELSGNNEKLLVQFNNFGTKLGSVMNENSQNLTININKFKDEFKQSINEDFEGLNKKIENRLDMMNSKVEERLSKGFEETTKTFGNVLERLSKIDEAQKKIETLSTNIVSLQDVLTDKKSRGIFGEIQLYQILASIFGEKNDKIYATQYKLSNGTIVDSILFTPEPMGNIAIDSKFPLENYRKIYNQELTEIERIQARKDFVSNMKKHIDAISNKYIIENETSDQAILFLPAEAIFAEINAYHSDVLEYANKKNVRITSPTTLMSILTIVQVTMKNIERNKYANIIHEELSKLQEEFVRYETRWTSLQKDIEKVTKDVKEIATTSTKISKRFTEISNVKIVENEPKIEQDLLTESNS